MKTLENALEGFKEIMAAHPEAAAKMIALARSKALPARVEEVEGMLGHEKANLFHLSIGVILSSPLVAVGYTGLEDAGAVALASLYLGYLAGKEAK